MSLKSKPVLSVVLAVSLAMGAWLIWSALAGDSDGSASTATKKQPKPLLVDVTPVVRGAITETLELSGEIVATESVVIAATKDGPIKYCPWREGDSVLAGEKLVEIDREVHRAEVRVAQAALAVARSKLADLESGTRPEEIDRAQANVKRWQATLEDARKNYERQSELFEQEFTSQQNVDGACERMEVAQAELAATREVLRMLEAGATPTAIAVQSAIAEEAAARLALSQAHLAECVIAAPFDGTITKVYVRAGDLASSRVPLLEMFAPTSLVIRFAVPEARAATVRVGIVLHVALDALPRRTFSAEVVRVYPELETTLRTRIVEARFTEPVDPAPGMFARLTLECREAHDAIVVPAETILTTATGEQTVFVVVKGKAHRRNVVLGIQRGDAVQIVEGLEVGERVVVAGHQALRDGQSVRVAGEPKSKGGQGSAGSPRSSGRTSGQSTPGKATGG